LLKLRDPFGGCPPPWLTLAVGAGLRLLSVPDDFAALLGGWFSSLGRAFLLAGVFGRAPGASVVSGFLLVEVCAVFVLIVDEVECF
jgi:hypothetical protein